MSAWIRMIEDDEAEPTLRSMFDRVRAPSGSLDNVMRVHSLRPHTMLGHYALYMSVLHDDGNTLPGWFQETVASYVSIINRCDYSLTNHWANAAHLIDDDERAGAIRTALDADDPALAFSGKELALLRYAAKLTRSPGDMQAQDVDAARVAGANDGEILEVNQICAYFCYVNRLLNGLGVTLAGDVVGFYSEGA